MRARNGSIKSGIIERLRAAAGAWVSAAELIDFLYRDDPDGGPETADNSLRVEISRLRKSGAPIESHRTGPGSLGYRWAVVT